MRPDLRIRRRAAKYAGHVALHRGHEHVQRQHIPARARPAALQVSGACDAAGRGVFDWGVGGAGGAGEAGLGAWEREIKSSRGVSRCLEAFVLNTWFLYIGMDGVSLDYVEGVREAIDTPSSGLCACIGSGAIRRRRPCSPTCLPGSRIAACSCAARLRRVRRLGSLS